MNWQNLPSLSTPKDTPSPHHSHTLTFPPPQSFPIGVLKAWSACVAAMVCALLAASIVLSFLGFSKGDCSYKAHWNPYSTAWISDTHLFVSAPEHVACLFPRQLINWLFGISELNYFSSLCVSSLTGTIVLCVHVLIADLTVYSASFIRALHDIILCICCRAML